MAKKKEEIVTTTIRLPRDLWLALRRLEEQGKIDSIQQAAIRSLWVLVERWAKVPDDDSGRKDKNNQT